MILFILAAVGVLGIFSLMVVLGASALNASDDDLLDEKHEHWPEDDEP